MRLTFIILLISYNLGWAQNLVPNPSFEDNDTCPYALGNLSMLHNWVSVRGPVSYYNECGINGCGIPINYGGGYANTGQAYIGFKMWSYPSQYESQFGGVELLSPLIAGKKYKAEFYVSLWDSVWYAIKNVGMYFSQSQPPANITTLLSYEPQVKYTGNEYLSDKNGWMKIEGSFFAEGGEQFITIGNFDGQPNTDTLRLTNGYNTNGIGCATLTNPNPQVPDGETNYLGIADFYNNREGVVFELSTPLPDGTNFQLSFLGHGKSETCPPTYNFYLSENPPCGLPGVWNACTDFVPANVFLDDYTLNTADWQLYGPFNFTVNSANPVRFLTITGQTTLIHQAYGYLDNITIIPELTPVTITSIVSDNTPCPDDEFTIEYEICNTGTLNTGNMQFIAELPFGFDSDYGGGFDDLGVSDIIDLDPNECVTLTLTVTADASIAGTTSTIYLSPYAACSITDPPGDIISVLPDILTIDKTVTNGSIFDPGDQVNYSIQICNISTQDDITNITITDDVPIQFTSISTTDFTVNGNTLTKTIGTLAANSCITYTFSATIDPDLTNCDDALIVSNCAVVTSAEGACTLPTECEEITINIPSGNVTSLISSFTTVAGTLCIDATNGAEFTNTSVSALSFLWEFGDGQTSTDENPMHVYTSPGWYQVVLYVYDDCENIDMSWQEIYIYPHCCSEPANFVYDRDDVLIQTGVNDTWQPGNIDGINANTATFSGTITVPDGVTLTVASSDINNTIELQFGPLGRILVERGGTLNFGKNILLTNVSIADCDPDMWQGIEVWGNSAYDHSSGNLDEHGLVTFSSGGYTQLVENAHIGVLLGRRFICFNPPGETPGTIASGPLCKLPWSMGYSGGIIDAHEEGLTFRYNGNDIRFIRYKFNNEISQISNVTFAGTPSGTLIDPGYDINNADYTYPNIHNPWMAAANDEQRTTWGIHNWSVNLTNVLTENTFDEMEEGIRSFDARYKVQSCDFTDMKYGIRIFNANSSSANSHVISGCNFNRIKGASGSAGVEVNAGRGDYVGTANVFGLTGNDSQSDNNIGVSMNNSNAYKIEDNFFNRLPVGIKAYGSNQFWSYIRYKNSTVGGNTFTRTSYNIIPIINKRLTIKCNNHDNPETVAGEYSGVNWLVVLNLSNQGHWYAGATNPQYPTGNKFTPAIIDSRRELLNTGILFNPIPFNYVSHSNPLERQIYYAGITQDGPINHNSNTVAFPSNPDEACSPRIIIGRINGFLGEMNEKSLIIDSLQNEYETVESNLDSGMTQDILDDIADTLMSEDSLKNNLIYASPLSDTVLISMLYHRPEYADQFYKAVILPNSPVSAKVRTEMDKILTEIAESTADSILQAQVWNPGVHTLKYLSDEIEFHLSEKQEVLSGLVSRLVENDSLGNALQVMWEADSLDDGTVQAYISSLAYCDSVSKAGDKLTDYMPEEEADSLWKVFTGILLDLQSDSLTWFEMDSAQEATVRAIAAICPASLAGTNAQSVLQLVFNEEINNDPLCGESGKWDGMQQNQQQQQTLQQVTAIEKKLKIYPNPADNSLNIEYPLESEEKGRIEVFSLNGVRVNRIQVNSGQQKTTLSTSNLRQGMYFIIFTVNDELKQSERIVIIHD